MAEPTQQPEIAVDGLTAFADGELQGADQAAVQAHLTAHPATAARVAAAARFRQGVAAAFLATTPTPSDDLKHRIGALATLRVEPGVDDSPSSVIPHPHRNWRTRVRLAAAAMILLAVGIVTGRLLYGPSPAVNQSPVPASIVADITWVHVDCSRAPDLHTAAFPKQLGKLEGQLERYLGRPVPYPDLRPIGYTYIGAGPCGKPAERTVHLLYKAVGGPFTDTVSLFVQPYQGQVHVDEGKVYWAAGRDAAHPMIVWRKDDMVFYLVGDAEQPVVQAAGLMHVHAPL